MSLLPFAVAFIVTLVFMPYIYSMLKNSGALKENYMGVQIPVGMGIVFIPGIIAGSTALALMPTIDKEIILINILGVSVMGFVGMVDDLLGNRNTLGFRGHIKELFRGTLTTGGFKALVGGLTAILVSLFISGNLLEWLLNALIIALFTNALNLMDLRPGRSIKFFILVLFLSLAIFFDKNSSIILLPLAGSLLAYIPIDFKGRGMMGDTGSNILGFTTGLYYSLETLPVQKLSILLLLVLLHVIGEKYSLTNIIEKSRVLSFIDRLGTVQGKGGRCR